MDIKQAFDQHQDQLMAIPGITGVGIGAKEGKPAIVVMVGELTPELKASLPQSLAGHPVVVEESGEISAF
jgi:hypothetical protein